MDNNLDRLSIQARILDEARKRTEHLPEEIQSKKSVEQILGEQVLKECNNICSINDYLTNVPDKIKNTLEISISIQDFLYRIQESYSDYNKLDEQLKKMLNENYEKIVDILLDKLIASWKNSSVQSVKEEPKTEVKEEPKVEPKAEELANQILSLITKKEELTSPSGDKYIIETCIGDISQVRHIETNKKYNVKNDIVINWKRG